MKGSAFVPGEPVLSGGRGQDSWQTEIRTRLRHGLVDPALTFVVSGLRRRGHPFDLDNLVHPVLMVLDEPIDCVSARIHVGEQPGLLIEDSKPGPVPSHSVHTLYLETHSEKSDRTRPPIAEMADDPVCDEHEGIGLSLEFDRTDIPIRKGWFGPTEAVIDDLVPWLGRYTSRQLIADHRIRDLRITRGLNPARRGVRISLWYVPDDEIPAPDNLARRIRTAHT